MQLRKALAVASVALLAVPVAGAAKSKSHVVASAKGKVSWTIPLPNAFGVEVVSDPLAFKARKYSDGTAGGHFYYRQLAGGDEFVFAGDVTCMNVYDGNRAKIGGLITESSDPTIPVGSYGWFQVFDNGHGAKAPPDRSSLVGFGDEAANEAFCNSPNLPRFGPWDVQGDIKVKTSS